MDAAQIDREARKAATEPSDAQKESGNYRKAHVRVHGLDIAIENARGSKRSGIGADGEPWEVTMPAHYGYIKRTEGADGDHVDVYLGPETASPWVFVLDQKDAETGEFDEHKVFIGYRNEPHVMKTYAKAFSDGRHEERAGALTRMPVDKFKTWLASGDQQKPLKRAQGGRIPMQSGGGLPPGFTLDEAPAGLPSGFSVDAARPAWDTADVAKSAGIGLARGPIQAVGLPGDVEKIVRGNLPPPSVEPNPAGKVPPVNPAIFPGSAEIQSAIEGTTGKFYEPQSTAGEIARSATEAVSNPLSYVGPGGVGGKAIQAAAGGMGSELLGQLLKGDSTESYGRIVGAVLGSMTPRALARSITPLPITPERQAFVDTLRGEGINPTAGQVTGRKALRYAESHLGDTPFAGGRATEAERRIGEEHTRAMLRRVGENADHATPQVVDRAGTRIGNQFDRLAARNDAPIDRQYFMDLNQAARDYDYLFQDPLRRPMVESIVQHAYNQFAANPTMSGAQYKAVRSRVERMRRGQAKDPELSMFLADVRNAMDDLMERSMLARNSPDIGAWREVRTQYRNLLPIERAAAGGGEAAAEGILTPARMRQAITSSPADRRGYARGRGDYADVVRAGNAILTPLPQSGTAPRAIAHAIPAAAAGALGFGSHGPDAAMLAALAAPAVTGRLLMSRPVQGYLAGQTAPQRAVADLLRRMPSQRSAALRALAPNAPYAAAASSPYALPQEPVP